MKKSFLPSCVLAMVFCLVSAISVWGAGTDYSNWTMSLSGQADDASYAWIDEEFKMVVSGQNVHVVWRAVRTDYGEQRLNYRHSTDGGKTFRPIKTLAAGATFDGPDFSSEWQILAVEGTTVHVVYTSGWPSGMAYLRSTDNGDTFETPRVIHGPDYHSYTGIYMVAANGVVTVATATNNNNGAWPRRVDCVYSNDGGTNFTGTNIAYSDKNSPSGWIWSYRVADMIRSGADIYVLYTVSDQNEYSTPSHLYLVASNDGGATFNPSQLVTLAASNGLDYANTTQDYHYSPNLATVGNNVYVTWVNTDVRDLGNYDLGSLYTLRLRRSTDKGLSLEAPVTLTPQSLPKSVLPGGQETVAASGNNVYVVSTYKDGSGTYLWRSTDSGSSFELPRKISDGGWWPTLLIDPNDASGARLHLANYYYVTSADYGTSFKGVVTLPPSSLGGWSRPILAVGSDGVVHYAASYSRYDTSTTHDIYYRRLAPAPMASGPAKALSLTHDSSFRSDNMQVAASPGINLTSALSIEFWFRKMAGGDINNYSIVVAKKRASGAGTYEFGLWNQGPSAGRIWTRLVTESSTDQYYGNFLDSGVFAQDDVWNHIAVTYDANAGTDNWKIYVDGELKNYATLTGNMVMDYMPLVLGFVTGSPVGSQGTGEIADFRVWNRARSAAEIKADMNHPLTGTESGLMAYYNFKNTTRDMTGHGNDGVLMYQESFVPTTINQTGTLTGLVLNSEGFIPVSDITVKATKGTDSFTRTTDGNGNFSFIDLATGDYVVELISTSYWSSQRSLRVMTGETTQLTITGIPQAIVNDIRNGLVTQDQLNQAVSAANAAKDLIIATMFTKAQLDTAVADANATCNLIVTEKDQIITTLNSTIVSKDQTISSMFTQQQLDQAVTVERIKWDPNNDGQMGLVEVIYIMQKLVGVR